MIAGRFDGYQFWELGGPGAAPAGVWDAGSPSLEVNERAGHEPVTLASPIGVLGICTVGDLVAVLTTAAELVADSARLTRRSPVEELGLSQRALRPLLNHWCGELGLPPTIGDVMDLAERDRLGDVRNLGKARVAEVLAALDGAGFRVRGRRQGG